MDRDRINRILVRFLILLGCVFFWGAVLSLIVSCKAQRSVEREVLTNNVKTEDVKIVQEVQKGVSKTSERKQDERRDYDVTISEWSAPDSTGKQHVTKVVTVSAKEARTEHEVRMEDARMDSVVRQAKEAKQTEVKEERTTKTDTGGFPWWLIPLGCLGVWIVTKRVK
jgi:hypothetical protein